MQTTANYFISNNNRAYRSEIALFRHAGETAENCWMVSALAGASILYEVVGWDDSISVMADFSDAIDQFLRTKAQGFYSIPVVD